MDGAMTVLTPAQVLERRRELLLNQDTDGFADLFAPGGVIEIPFAGPGLPARLDGQQAIRDFSSHIAASALRIDDLNTVAVHHTDDPEVLIVELVANATVTTTGRAFTARSIQVFRIRDGKILLFRDYANPNALAEAFGA
jgi:ketosteroid isomerase-like protein